MPRLEVTQRTNPTFGEQLGAGLGQGIAGGINDFLEQKKNRSQLEGLAPALEQLGMPKEGIAEMLKQNVPYEKVFQVAQLQSQKRNAELSAQTKLQSIQAKKDQVQEAEQRKIQQEEKEKKQKYGTFRSLTKKMEELKPYVGETKIPFMKSFGGHLKFTEAAKKRRQVNTTRLALEGLFRDLTLKGQFPKAIYERVLEELPNAEDSEKEYQGKLDAINDILEAHFGTGEAEAEMGEDINSSEEQKDIVAVNPQTGKRLVLRNGKWQPLQ